jgi:hypothetical protein
VRSVASYEDYFRVIVSSLFEFHYELQHDGNVEELG